MSAQCLYNACTVSVKCVTMSVQWMHRVCTMSLQCLCHSVQCLHSDCTVFVQCTVFSHCLYGVYTILYSVCTASVQWLCNVCAVIVQCLRTVCAVSARCRDQSKKAKKQWIAQTKNNEKTNSNPSTSQRQGQDEVQRPTSFCWFPDLAPHVQLRTTKGCLIKNKCAYSWSTAPAAFMLVVVVVSSS